MEILNYIQAPKYMQYDYVYTRYRVGGNWKDCLWSVFAIHSETFNIWSMIFINIFSLYLMVQNPVIGLISLTSSALIHLPFSLGYHIFMPISERVFILWRKLDVSFIFIASIFLTYALDCYIFPWSVTVMHIFFTVLVAYEGINNFWRCSNQAKIDHLRHTYLLSTVILCYMFPVICKIVYDIAIKNEITNSVIYGILLIKVLLLCGYAFSKEWPQILFPGKLDLIGNSHNIVHITAAIAHILEYLFILENYNSLYSNT